MTPNEQFGLPDIVVEVLRKQNLDTSLHLSYKLFGSGQYTELKLTWSPLRTEWSNIRTARRKIPLAYRRDSQRKLDYENRKQNDNVNVNPGMLVPPKNITSLNTASQCELINNNENNPDKDTSLNRLPVWQTRSMTNHPEIPPNCNSISEHTCLLSPEHPDITLNPNAQAFSPVSPMLNLSDSPNSEFVNNYNLRCMVDLLADEVVATEIDIEGSDSEGEDLPGDILPCDDHPRCAYYTDHCSIYETVETQLYVYNKCTTKKGCITSYLNVCFPCYAKGNHKRHMKHMTVDNT